jgi:hypothetical protein
MKLASWMSVFCVVGCALALPPDELPQSGASGKESQSEVNVVLRVSRKFIAELTTRRFQRTDPVYLCVLDSPITGTAQTDATFTVDFDTSSKESAFVLKLQGSTASSTIADRTLLQVFGSGQMDFTVRKRVTFDGKKFRGQPSIVDAHLSSAIDGIATPGGLVGWIIEMIAEPIIRRQQPVVAEVAYEDGTTKLADAFDQETNKLVAQLNQVSPLQETIEALFPETRDWTYSLSTTPTHLIIGAGPPGLRVPELPSTKRTEAPIELWVRGKEETQGMLKVIQLWKDAGKQLETLLPEELQKSIKIGDSFKTAFVKGWFVIQLGAVSAKDRPVQPIVEPAMIVWRPTTESAIKRDVSETSSQTEIVWRPAMTSRPDAVRVSNETANHISVIWRPTITPSILTRCQESGR